MTTYIERQVLLDESVTLRRCALWRNVFKGSSVSFPVQLMSSPPVAAWMGRCRVTVDVDTAAELDMALACGIQPAQLVMHPRDGAALARAAAVRAARLVISSEEQATVAARGAQRIEQVLVAGGARSREVMAEVLAHRQLDVVGLHCAADPSDDPLGMGALRSALADMVLIRRRCSVVLSRISLAGLDGGQLCLRPWALRQVAEALDEVVHEQCARYRYPRPALTVAPSFSALLPRNLNVA
ncbi:hypothetical protein A5699_06920 [Mycobacterium sp. E802]|uniref:hypothetical protein n=1 Tax=Mycobacterium sp. E802 TaxID=1834152 RepID=UPI0007FF251A|nr:hypothetical protein [Mycobacterium sp. E802]OBG82115.1 hypothetical protein A5699_06920 [Mycobacterium sp. E802]